MVDYIAYLIEELKEIEDLLFEALGEWNSINLETAAVYSDKASELIPVWQAKVKVQELIERIENSHFQTISTALEEWINLHNEEMKDKPYLILQDDRSYTLREILHEIKLQTKLGKDFEKRIAMLTIELLARNKENL